MEGYKFYGLVVIVKWNQPTHFCTQFFIIMIFSIALKFRTYHCNSLVITHLFAYCHTLLFPMAHTNPIVTHWCFRSLHNIPWVFPNKIIILGKWCVVVEGCGVHFFVCKGKMVNSNWNNYLYTIDSHIWTYHTWALHCYTLLVTINWLKKKNCFCGN
jgi:hypothetical protein